MVIVHQTYLVEKYVWKILWVCLSGYNTIHVKSTLMNLEVMETDNEVRMTPMGT